MTQQANEDWLNHFYIYGEAYEALDLCSLLDITLSRLVREGLLGQEAAGTCKERVAEVRNVIGKTIPDVTHN